jgi:hypothetical protein
MGEESPSFGLKLKGREILAAGRMAGAGGWTFNY